MTVNVTLGRQSWTDEATLYAIGSSAAGYGVDNMKTMPLTKVWRTADASLANTRFRGTLPQLRRVDNLWLVWHNMSRDALVRRRLYRTDGASPSIEVYDSGWLPWLETLYTFDQVDHDGGNLHDRTYTPEELEGLPRYDPHFVDGELYADEFIIEIDDPTNSDGYVQVGYVAIEQAQVVSVNPQYGSAYGFRGRTLAEEAESGYKAFDRLDKPRVFTGSIDYLPTQEAKGVFYELQRQADINKPFTLWIDRDDTLNKLRDAWLARNADLPRISYQVYDRDAVPFTYEEVIG